MSTKDKSTPAPGSQPRDLQAMSSKCYSPATMVKEQPAKTHKGPKSRITINFDVGFSNVLYIRGQGANLSWNKGLLLTNVKPDEWIWETTKPFTTCEFKVLINDSEYEAGDNHTLTCGSSIQYTPEFN